MRLRCRSRTPPDLALGVVEHQFTEALPSGLRAAEPLKITSAIDSPRRCLAEISPITQRTESMMFDLPQPFGPTSGQAARKRHRGRVDE